MSGPRNPMICLGVVGGPHGVRGEFRVKTFTAMEEDIAAYGPVSLGATDTPDSAQKRLTLSVVRVVKPGVVLVRAREITNREEIASLTGRNLYVARSALPEITDDDDFYIDDLVGLTAAFADGTPGGTVTAIHNFGAGDLLEVRGAPGQSGSRFVRFTRELVPEVDIAGGRIVLGPDAFDEGVGDPEPADDEPRIDG